MKDFRRLHVWEQSHKVTLKLYERTSSFPKDEICDLTSQNRRATLSMPTNIAEGCGCGSDGDMKRFMYIAMGSASETEYLLLTARDLGYLPISQDEPLQVDIVDKTGVGIFH